MNASDAASPAPVRTVPPPLEPPAGHATPPAPAPEVPPADMPGRFWAAVDYLLHEPERMIASIRLDVGLGSLSRRFLAIIIAMAALYGAVMGATNLLQSSPLPLRDKLLLIVCVAIKVPVLFLVTLAIVLPPVYVSNAFVGARLRMRQMSTSLLAAMALTVTALASMATVAGFFALTSRSYSFIKLLHVAVFVYAGITGLMYLARCMQAVQPSGPRRMPRWLFVLWLVLYMFVGTQMAWVLRPFVGSHDRPFELFRPRYGNFYESVLHAAGQVFNE